MNAGRDQALPKRRHGGFTLIELMSVVVVIGALSAIAYPSYQGYIVRSKRAAAQADLLVLTQRLEQIYTQSGTYRPGAVDPSLPFTASPPSGTASYVISLPVVTADSFTLRATPIGPQGADGVLEIDGTGARRWDADNSGTFEASENKWTR